MTVQDILLMITEKHIIGLNKILQKKQKLCLGGIMDIK